ncbi:DUF2188 domain-containing protein [Alkalihalobacillus pseudalcaliphilus]|uniref:DUF2188 domain-containing protein n=1 Tax=Alkalihalobacillus pseudalcaliphilus TaxID=79884 RepID=UPI00064D957B|nr:DUF2188 domain-containing protein [Alkalihalobacillus pseudalcaliphilus]KMK77728.1 hypothetical protein AB990_04540 [Alkalihalobacillus pseudalcaliphilus]
MPWNLHDYPSSLKNLNKTIRHKAIEIANSMIEEGYDEQDALPIATSQAKKWYSNASYKEKEEMNQASHQDIQADSTKQNSSSSKLQTKGQYVLAHEKGWAVKAEGAKGASNIFTDKKEAIKRAREIAKNKETHLVVLSKNGSVQEKISYEKKSKR